MWISYDYRPTFCIKFTNERATCRIAAARLALDEMVDITNKMKDRIEHVKKLAKGENLNKLKRKEQSTELAAFHLRWTGKRGASSHYN